MLKGLQESNKFDCLDNILPGRGLEVPLKAEDEALEAGLATALSKNPSSRSTEAEEEVVVFFDNAVVVVSSVGG